MPRVIDDLVDSYNADARRIYAGGYSMGGSLWDWRVPRVMNLPPWPPWPPACIATRTTTVRPVLHGDLSHSNG